MLKVMLEAVTLTCWVSLIPVLGTAPLKGFPGECGFLCDKSTVLCPVINE